MIDITPLAEVKLRQALLEHQNKAVRLTVSAGGCNGFKHEFIIDVPAVDDVIISFDGGHLLMDPDSFDLLAQAQIDCIEDIQGSRLVLLIPSAASRCGCGASFSL